MGIRAGHLAVNVVKVEMRIRVSAYRMLAGNQHLVMPEIRMAAMVRTAGAELGIVGGMHLRLV